MIRPRLLDAFSCAGGASMGYQRAGFDVVGVDINPQPNYPFEFHQADAIDFITQHGHEFHAIAGSPPCQHFAAVTSWRGNRGNHVNLIPQTRRAMIRSGRPWVIENVPEAARHGELRPDFFLCGSMFGLRIRRHRVFETSWPALQLTPKCAHRRDSIPFEHKDERAFADAMGCTWMSAKEGRQAIPPDYTQHIGEHLLAHLREENAA